MRNRANASILAFGLNNYGQLGINKKHTETIFSPQLTSLENVKMITGECKVAASCIYEIKYFSFFQKFQFFVR